MHWLRKSSCDNKIIANLLLITASLSYQDLGCRRTETTHQQQVGRSETQLLTVLFESGVTVYALAFVVEADILSTGLNKDCVM